ncbi:MAG: carboxypeptidase-like regulatory domain-containing protein [Cytophagales bacterium]|nr:carboxypeptidase-like regulatory domain-containing protein [Cytophagales bacterium]
MLFKWGCASQAPPTGGPKDIDPPKLIKVEPPSGSIRFKEKTIVFSFDEIIQERNLKKNLIITPQDEFSENIEFSIQEKRLIINLKESPRDSITYSLDLSNCLTDINEKTPIPDLKYTLTAGHSIDSLSISGRISDALTQKGVKGASVVLAFLRDSISLIRSSFPYYTRTNEAGYFRFQHLPKDSFLLFSFTDLNANKIMEVDKEAHGFLRDSIFLNKSIDSLEVLQVLSDARPLRKTFARPYKSYFEIIFNKPLARFHCQLIQSEEKLFYHLIGKKKEKIRIYPCQEDSLQLAFEVGDNIGNILQDSVLLIFSKTNTAKEDFSFEVFPTHQSSWTDPKDSLIFHFSKPVQEIQIDSLLILRRDSSLLSPTEQSLSWNKNKTELRIKEAFESKDLEKASSSLGLILKKNAFISIEQDSSAARTLLYPILEKEQLGEISGKLNFSTPRTKSLKSQYIIQLISQGRLVKEQIISSDGFHFKYILPETYHFRIIWDRNLNKRWDPGNILLRVPPEAVYLSKTFLIRANWYIENFIITVP